MDRLARFRRRLATKYRNSRNTLFDEYAKLGYTQEGSPETRRHSFLGWAMSTVIEKHVETKTEFRLILASPSPARLDFLQQLGLDIEVIPGILEDVTGENDPETLLQTRAVMQASTTRIVANSRYGSNRNNRIKRFVIGMDTAILIDGKLLFRPSSVDDACDMLRTLSGRTHEVITGLAIIDSENNVSCSVQTTEVTFKTLDESEIQFFARSSEALYNVGAYSLTGNGAIFVKSVNGCFGNALGVPLPLISEILKKRGLLAASAQR